MTAPVFAPTLGEQLARAAEAQGVGVRFLDRREQETFLSYRELHRRARKVAGALRAHGLTAGAKVGLVLPTGPEFYDAFFGCQLAGLVPVPLYPPVRLGRLDEYYQRTAAMLRAVDASLVLTDARVRRLLGPVVEAAAPSHGCLAVQELSAGEALAADAPAARADDLAFIQLSSGTTVEPKPICLTHRQVQANVAAILGAILQAFPEGPASGDGSTSGIRHAGVSWLPLYHDMGLVGCVLTALARPGDLTLIPPELFVARPAVWLRAISRHRGTISPAPNFAYSLCVDKVRDADLEGVDLSSWRVALNGAEPVTPAVLERFIQRFGRWGLRPEALTPVYGLAEATLAVTFSPLSRPFRWRRFDNEALTSRGQARSPQSDTDSNAIPLVSLGEPLPGFKVRIVDRAGAGLPPGRLGRVQVCGPSIMAGYYGRPRQSREALRDGWLDTGDNGFLLDGELYLHGREKDLIILAGRNHAPQELEQCLDGLPGVRTGCVAAVGVVPPDQPGERLLMLVERAQAQEQVQEPTSDSDLEEAIRARLAQGAGQKPWRVELLAPGTLPRTSSGKIRRGEARCRYLAHQLTPPEPTGWLSLAGHLVRSRLSLARAKKSARNSLLEADHPS